MKPVAFDYLRAESLEMALTALHETETDTKILAGGQSLIPMLNMRLARPARILDIGRLTELQRIEDDGDSLKIGALVPHHRLECSSLVHETCPILAFAESLIGHPAIRSRGTIGGSVSHADPAAELPLLLRLLDGSVELASRSETRTVPAEELFLSFFVTSILPEEILTHVRVPKLRTSSGWSLKEIARRHGDFALVLVGTILDLNPHDGRISRVRIALGGVGEVPLRATPAEDLLQGQLPSQALWRQAAKVAGEALDPMDDIHATAAMRRHLAITLITETLTEAAERIGGTQ